MIEIPLTKNRVALIDDIDYAIATQYKWHSSWSNETDLWYAVHRVWDEQGTHLIWLHRLILGVPDGILVDHIDHNGCNDQRDNLRACTHSQNHANQRKLAKASSRFKGVCWHTQAGKWCAYIMCNYKSKYLGLFVIEEDAALAYNKAATKLFGEFALLNIIPEVS